MPEKATLTRTLRFDQMAVLVNDRIDNPSEAKVDRYVGLEHLDSGSLKIRRWGKTTDVEATKLLFKSGDIILGRRRVYQRKLAVADFDGICSAHAMVFRAKPGAVLPEFLPFFMQSDTFMGRALEISVGSLSPTINWKTLAKEKFALPPLEVQRRIAEVLQGVQQAVEAHRKAEWCFLRLRDAMCVKFWNSKQQVAPMVPLDQLSLKIQDGTHFSPQSSGGEFRYITSKNIRDGYLDISTAGWISKDEHESIHKRCDVRAGDLLLTKDGANAGNIAINTLEEPFSLLSSVAFIRPDPTCLDPIYAFEYLRSCVGRARLLAHVKGSAITRLTLTQIRGFKILAPGLAVQKRYAAKLSQIQLHLDRLSARLSILAAIGSNVRQLLEER